MDRSLGFSLYASNKKKTNILDDRDIKSTRRVDESDNVIESDGVP